MAWQGANGRMVWRGARRVRDERRVLQDAPSPQSATRVLWAAMLPRLRLGVSKLNSSWFPVLLEHELAAAGVALLGSLLLFVSSAFVSSAPLLCSSFPICPCVRVRRRAYARTHALLSSFAHTRSSTLSRLLSLYPLPPSPLPPPLLSASSHPRPLRIVLSCAWVLMSP